jgi:cytoskeletal protein RodZ
MNPKKNKTFAQVIVWIMVVGLIGSMAPLIFQKPQVVQEPKFDYPPQTASLTTQQVPTTTPSSTTTPPASEKISPDSFKGLNEEGQSVKDLDNLLNQ